MIISQQFNAVFAMKVTI